MFLRHRGPKFESRLQWKKIKNLLKKIELSSSPGRSTYIICCDRQSFNNLIMSSLQGEWHRFMSASSWIFYYAFLYLFLSYTYVYFISLMLASFFRFTMLKCMIFIMSEKDSIFKSYQLKFIMHHEYSYKKFYTFWYSNQKFTKSMPNWIGGKIIGTQTGQWKNSE